MACKKILRTAFLLYACVLLGNMRAGEASKQSLWQRTKGYASGVKERVVNRFKTIKSISSGDETEIVRLLNDLIKRSNEIDAALLSDTGNCNTNELFKQRESLSKNIVALFSKLKILNSKSESHEKLLNSIRVYFCGLERERSKQYETEYCFKKSADLVDSIFLRLEEKDRLKDVITWYQEESTTAIQAIKESFFLPLECSDNGQLEQDINSLKLLYEREQGFFLEMLKSIESVAIDQPISEKIEKDLEYKRSQLSKALTNLERQLSVRGRLYQIASKELDSLTEVEKNQTPLRNLLLQSAQSLATSKEVLVAVAAGACLYNKKIITEKVGAAAKSAAVKSVADVKTAARYTVNRAQAVTRASKNVSNYAGRVAKGVKKVVKPVQRSASRAYTGVSARIPRR